MEDAKSTIPSTGPVRSYVAIGTRVAAFIIDLVVIFSVTQAFALVANLAFGPLIVPDTGIMVDVRRGSFTDRTSNQADGSERIVRTGEQRVWYFGLPPAFVYVIQQETVRNSDGQTVVGTRQLVDADTKEPISRPSNGMISLMALLPYFVLLEGSPWAATIGKRVLRVAVADDAGRRLTWGRVLVRNLAKLVFVGFFMAAWSRKKQALHDRIAGTIVLRVARG